MHLEPGLHSPITYLILVRVLMAVLVGSYGYLRRGEAGGEAASSEGRVLLAGGNGYMWRRGQGTLLPAFTYEVVDCWFVCHF
jgi:hypothetical protein